MVNKVSRRKSTAKVKLKANSQEERIHLWKQHFENLLRKPLKVTHEPITKIISCMQFFAGLYVIFMDSYIWAYQCLCVGVHKKMLLMSSSLLLWPYSACFVYLT